MFIRKHTRYAVATIVTLVFLFASILYYCSTQKASNVPSASYNISEPTLSASDGLSRDDITVVNTFGANLKNPNNKITIVLPHTPEQIKYLMTIAQCAPTVWGIGDYELEYSSASNGNCKYSITPNYLISKSEGDEQWQAICKKAESVLQEMCATNTITDSESAAKAIYNWICKNVDYVDVDGNSSKEIYPYNGLYSAIVSQEAICGGFAKLFCFLMSCLGYESGYCTGYSPSGQYHAWNALRIGEKKVYYDATYGSGYLFESKFCAKESLDTRQLESICWYD